MGYIHTSHILGGDTSVTGVPLHPVPQVQDLEQTVQGLPYLRRSLPDQLQAGGQVNRLAAAAAGGVALPLAVDYASTGHGAHHHAGHSGAWLF